MTTPEQDLKNRMTTVLKDINDVGSKDPQAMWVLGSIGAQILTPTGKPSWRALRAAINDDDYKLLVNTFRDKGNEFAGKGDTKAAYAVQALSLSVVARSQTDKAIIDGASLLDDIIDRAIIFFRHNPPTKQ